MDSNAEKRGRVFNESIVETVHLKDEVSATVIKPEISLAVVVEPIAKTAQGELVRCIGFPWKAIVARLSDDWNAAMQMTPRQWEELVAGAFDLAGFDEVTLTPRSGDHGKDVIAVKNGIGCIRIIDSVKRYRPSHLVTADEVRSLCGVLLGDPKASKGIFTTTSDFAPRITSDHGLASLMPYRLELMNGERLRQWLQELAAKR